MDYKTLISDINVANEVLFAEDEEKGSKQYALVCASILYNRPPLQDLFVIWNGWKELFKDNWLVYCTIEYENICYVVF